MRVLTKGIDITSVKGTDYVIALRDKEPYLLTNVQSSTVYQFIHILHCFEPIGKGRHREECIRAALRKPRVRVFALRKFKSNYNRDYLGWMDRFARGIDSLLDSGVEVIDSSSGTLTVEGLNAVSHIIAAEYKGNFYTVLRDYKFERLGNPGHDIVPSGNDVEDVVSRAIAYGAEVHAFCTIDRYYDWLYEKLLKREERKDEGSKK
ncbi:MAG: hypothetical protein GY861_22095 [bacterium]|nr:hypothetical protein [bacterium]